MFEYISFNIKIPYKFKRKEKHKHFIGYEVTYKKTNGIFITQVRRDMPRITECPEYVHLSLNDYIGCSNGYGWVITDVKIL